MTDKIWGGSFKKPRISRAGWSLLGITLLVSLPLLSNYCTGGKELAFHLNRVESMKNMLREGTFTLREGSVFLLIPAGLGMLGMSVQTAYKSFLFLINLATACLGYFCFARIFRDKTLGILGSMLYTWAPYRLDLLYCRAAFGEIAALAFFPLVLCGICEIYREETESKQYRTIWIIPALGYTCMVQANILCFLLAAGFTLLVCILYFRRTFEKKRFLALCRTVLAFGLVNSVYLISVLGSLMNEEGNLWRNVGFIQEKGLYAVHYLMIFFSFGLSGDFAGNGIRGTEPLGVGFAVTLCILTYLWMLLTGRGEKSKRDALWNMGKIMAVIGGGIAVMSMNSFPWDYLRTRGNVFLRFETLLQSPAKLVAVVIPAFIFVACLSVRQMRENSPELWKYYLAAVMITAFVTTQFLVGDIIGSSARLDIVTAGDIPEITATGSEYLP